MNFSIPTLTVNGNTTEVKETMIKIYQYFKIADYSQTYFYVGNISSLKYLLSFNYDDNELENRLKETLTTLYNRYFDNVTIYTNIENIKDNVKIINIQVNVLYNGNNYKFEDDIEIRDGKYMDKYIEELYLGK